MAYANSDESKARAKPRRAREDEALRKVHAEAMKRHDEARAFDEDERDLCVEDTLFCDVPGNQWDDVAKNGRRRAKRPMYEINKVALSRNQFVGDQRQNRIDIKVRPAGGETTRKLAETFEGLIRNICSVSKFDNAKDNALKEMATGGIGAWEVCTRETEDDGWDQEIYIKPIRSAATTIWIDPDSTDECHADAKWMFVAVDMSPEAFKERYPDSIAADFAMRGRNGPHVGWRGNDFVRIADYWVKEPIERRLVLMSNGETYEDDEEFKAVLDELAAAVDAQGNPTEPVVVTRRKTVRSHRVLHYKLSGAEVLSGPNEWAGRHIPIVVGYGFQQWIDGAHYYCGMVRKAKDPQRVYNYETSSSVETGALAPKDPYWLTTEQAKGYEDDISRMNVENRPAMLYNSDPNAPGPPRRTGAPAVQAAQIQRIAQAEADIQATTGYFAPSLGDNPRNQSGKALIAQQKQGFAGTYEIADNLAKMVERTGEILVDLVPRIYDSQRQARILKEDGETEMVFVNREIVDEQTGQPSILNDLSAGKFDVVVDIGPSFATKREEAVAFLTEIGRSNPLVGQLTTDLVVKHMDWPGAAEAHKRLRMAGIKQGFVEPNKEEEQEIQEKSKPSPQEMLAIEAQRAQVEKMVAEVDSIDLKNEKTRAEIAEKWAQVQKLMQDAPFQSIQTAAAAEKAIAEVESTINEARAADAQRARDEMQQGQQQQMALAQGPGMGAV